MDEELRADTAKAGRKLRITPAQKDQLHRRGRFRQALHDVQHYRRSIAAEENQAGRKSGIEPQFDSRSGAVLRHGSVETRMHGHSRNAPQPLARNADIQGLVHREIRPAHDVLVLPLQPEMRRVIGKVRHYR